MFDNLRDDSSSTFDDETEAKYLPAAGYSGRSGSKRFLGMTSTQRFVITVMIMLTVCILGSMVLLAFGKIGI